MKKKVVVLGGGTGTSYLLKGLKDFPVDITVVIPVSDDGKSTGKLRKEFMTPAVGDFRKILFTLSELPTDVKDVIEYRFSTYSDLNGHPIGNLMLTALFNMNGNLQTSISYMSKLLDVKQKVLPLSEDFLTLVGETVDGELFEGEDNLKFAKKKYNRIFYKEEVHVIKDVIDAINDADLIILSMGSLYTSLIPHLICNEVVDAIKNAKGKKMYLCNAMTQPGETDDFFVSDHIKTIEKYLGNNILDVVIASNTKIDEEILRKYETLEQKNQVFIDYDEVDKMDIELIESDLLTTVDGTIKHNSLKLSSIIFSYLMR